jgi:hypothetical protein
MFNLDSEVFLILRLPSEQFVLILCCYDYCRIIIMHRSVVTDLVC